MIEGIISIAVVMLVFCIGFGAGYSKTEVCPHDKAKIRTLSATCGCETTVLVCTECGKQLSKPKTEC